MSKRKSQAFPHVEETQGPCAHREALTGMLNTQCCLFKESCTTCFLPSRLGMDVVRSLMLCAICMARPYLATRDSWVFPGHPPQAFILSIVSPSTYRNHFCGRGHMYLSGLKLCCARGIELIVTRKLFSKLCCDQINA